MADEPSIPTNPKFKDERGKRYGRLFVTAYAGRRHDKMQQFLCHCDCGVEAQVIAQNLRRGNSKSCGCVSREKLGERRRAINPAGRQHPLTYSTWRHMRGRCFDSNNRKYSAYGGRGITICDRWQRGVDGKSGFECFLEDMGPRPSSQHSIDRFPDNDGNYEPTNCRWATATEQRANQRRMNSQ